MTKEALVAQGTREEPAAQEPRDMSAGQGGKGMLTVQGPKEDRPSLHCQGSQAQPIWPKTHTSNHHEHGACDDNAHKYPRVEAPT